MATEGKSYFLSECFLMFGEEVIFCLATSQSPSLLGTLATACNARRYLLAFIEKKLYIAGQYQYNRG